MKNKIIRTIFGAGIIAIASSASAEDSGRSVWEAIVDTLPAGVVSEENSSGSYLSDTWVGMKTIISEGSSGLLLPAYTIHPGYAYKTEKRHNENGYTWGGGISRNFIDSRGNRRIMYAMAFSDSHNNFEPFMGYGWLSRWRLGSTPFYAEAGYTIGLTARGDYKWIPFPAPLPLVGVGTDNFSIYGTYVPFSDIFFFFANMTFDDRKTRHMPDTPKSLFSNKVLIYAGGGWQKTTLKGTPKPSSISSDGAYSAGLRYFVTPEWALDFSVNRSGTHGIHANGSKVGSYKLTSYSLAVQYHFRALCRCRCRLLQKRPAGLQGRLGCEERHLHSGYSGRRHCCDHAQPSRNRRYGLRLPALQSAQSDGRQLLDAPVSCDFQTSARSGLLIIKPLYKLPQSFGARQF